MADVEDTLSDLQLQVYNMIKTAGWEGCTTDEIEAKLGRTHQSISARVNELANMKPKPLIEARAARRKTRAGKPAAIYILYGLRRANPAMDKADQEPPKEG
jgi:hypothetical protein